jgi:hypothetical protein
MLKMMAAAATSLALLGSVVVYAQQPPAPPQSGVPSARARVSGEDRAAFLDARIAAVHAGLRLTADQEKLWPAVEEAYRGLAALRAERISEQRTERPADPIQGLAQRADRLSKRGAALKRLADAAGPLYQSFDDNQKRRLGILVMITGPHFGGFADGRGGERREFGARRGEREDFGPGRGERGERREFGGRGGRRDTGRDAERENPGPNL